MPIASAFRFVLRLVGVALLGLISPAMMAATSAAADGFDPNVDGNVYAVAVQPDGHILIAGKFAVTRNDGTIGGRAHNNIARVLPDGTNDATFTSDVDGQINALVVQADGKIVIGGKFSKVEGQTRNRAARLNPNGTLDTSFDPNLSGSVTGIAGIDREVTAIALQADGKILLAGSFATVQPNLATATTTRKGVARFNVDGTFDASFVDLAVDGTVLAIAVQPADQQIVIGGGFTKVGSNSLARNRIARVNASGMPDSTFDPNPNSSIAAIAIQTDGKIVIGGTFTTLTPNGSETAITYQPRLARLQTTGLVDDTFAPIPDGPITTLKQQRDGRLLIGGSFSTTLAGSGAYAARLMPDGSTDFSFSPQPNFNVYAFDETADGSVIMGGGFTTMHGNGVNSVLRSHVARVSPSAVLDTDFRPDVNGRLETMVVDASGRILVGGSFTSAAGESRSGLYRLKADGTLDASFRADTNAAVGVIVPQSNGKIMIGGAFSTVNSTPRFYLARLMENGDLDSSFNADPNGQVTSIAVQGDKILVGGNFTSFSPWGTTEPITRVSFARLNTDGTVDLTFTAQAYQSVNMILVQPSDGKIIVGGSFTSVLPHSTATPPSTATVSRYHIARFNADGTLDTTFSPGIDGIPYGGVVQSDGQIVIVGNFSNIGGTGATAGTARKNIVRFKTDGTIDTTFDTSANDVITKIVAVADGKFLIGGYFTTLTPNAGTTVTRNYIARLNSAGTVDTAFDLDIDQHPGNNVAAIALAGGATANGKILVGGAFTTLKTNSGSPVQRNRLAQLTAELAVDTSFTPELGATQGAAIEALTLLSDGGVLVAGSFSAMSGTGSSNLAHFNGDGIANPAFFPNVDGAAGKVHSVAQLPTKGETVATQRPLMAWLESNGVLRSGISKGTDPTALSDVRALAVQADGKLLVAASVTRKANTVYSEDKADFLIRFNKDGTVDTGFQPLVNGTILAIRVQADQSILIGGAFSTVGLTSDSVRNNMARLNPNGSVDTTFNPNLSAGVASIEIQPADEKIIIGGSFTYLSPNGATTATFRNYLARLNKDGTLDTDFNPYPDNAVRAIKVFADGKILVGGFFSTLQPGGTTVGTAVARKYLARLNANGTLDSLDFKLNGAITQLVTQADNKVIVAGVFSSIHGQTRNYVARLNADADLTLDSFSPNPSAEVAAVAVQADGKIVIGGLFTALQPNSSTYDLSTATPRHYAARLNADGTLDPSFNPGFDANVGTLVVYPDGLIVAGGSFTSIQPAGSWLVGGQFSRISGVAVNNLALLSTDGSISATFLPNPNAPVRAVQVTSDGQVVVGGAFTAISGVTRNRLVRYTSSNALDPAFNPNVDDEVHALALQADGKLLVGGKFKNIGGAARLYLARLDTAGVVDSAFSPAVTGDVTAIAVQGDGRILVLSAGSGVRNVLSRLNADGSADATFTPVNAGGASLNCFVLQTDGKIVVGGAFKDAFTKDGRSHSYLVRLNADGTTDNSLTATPSGAVTALTIQSDGKILFGGAFNAVDGLPRFGLARIAAGAAVPSVFTVNAERTTLTWTRSGPGPELSGVVFQGSTDGSTWSTIGGGAGTRIAGTPNWRLGELGLDANVRYFVRAFGVIPGSSGGSSGILESRGQVYLSSVPVITSATAVGAVSGAAFTYGITANGSPKSYSATGLPAGLTLDPATGVISGTPSQAGTFNITLTATNPAGSTSAVLTLIVAASGGSGDTAGRLSNLAVLAQVTSASQTNGGFVLSGTGTQSVLIRAVGPGLSKVGVSAVLAAPRLKLYNAKGALLREADAWGGSSQVAAASARLGALPLDATSADVAFLATLPVGVYTFLVSDSGTAGGYALAEIYDATETVTTGAPRLVNLSARGVATGSSLVVGGFVVAGNTPKKVLIRGVGPGLSLPPHNVSGVLTDPKLELVRNVGGVNSLVASNDNWYTPVTTTTYPAASGAEIKAAASLVGAFALAADTSADAAILVTLQPGVYSAQVSGVGSATGAAMVEVYEVQ